MKPHEYNKPIKISNNLVLGYQSFFDKDHPLSMSNGMVFLHRHVAFIKEGEWLTSKQHVHHKDGDRGNNDPKNLEIMTASEHKKEHNKIDNKTVKTNCNVCNKEITLSRTRMNRSEKIYCSHECMGLSNRRFEVSESYLKELVWKFPLIEVSNMFGVSKNAIVKRCKKYEIKLPPRGHFLKGKPKKPLDDSVKEKISNSLSKKGDIKGHKTTQTKLSEDDVTFIYKNYKKRDPVYGARPLANYFGINHTTVMDIVNRKTWRFVTKHLDK